MALTRSGARCSAASWAVSPFPGASTPGSVLAEPKGYTAFTRLHTLRAYLPGPDRRAPDAHRSASRKPQVGRVNVVPREEQTRPLPLGKSGDDGATRRVEGNPMVRLHVAHHTAPLRADAVERSVEDHKAVILRQVLGERALSVTHQVLKTCLGQRVGSGRD